MPPPPQPGAEAPPARIGRGAFPRRCVEGVYVIRISHAGTIAASAPSVTFACTAYVDAG